MSRLAEDLARTSRRKRLSGQGGSSAATNQLGARVGQATAANGDEALDNFFTNLAGG
jgi:hypothetical protein